MSNTMEATGADVSIEYVLHAIQEYSSSENPSSFLAVNQGTSHFALPRRPGVVVYRPAGRYLIQFGGPFAPDDSYVDLIKAFVAFARSQGRKVASIQLQGRDARIYARHRFTVNQVGASYAVDLRTFTLSGSRFMQLRNKISRALRDGLVILEADYEEWQDAVREVDRVWLPLKGEGARPLEYLVGQTGGEMQKYRRLFIGLLDGQLVGYVSYSPVYGSNPGWMHDLSRRRPDGTPGIMEAINKAAIDAFQQEGVPWLHFGFTPFTSLSHEFEVEGSSSGFTWLMHYLWEHGEAVYPAATQLAYKDKWNQSLILPEYAAFEGRASIEGFVHIWRAANAM